MRSDRIEAECLGVRLVRVEHLVPPSEPQPDRWRARWDTTSNTDWSGPNDPATLDEWPDRIRKWRIAQQVAAGFTVWILSDDRPKYWREAEAVYRSGDPMGNPKHYSKTTYIVHCRNGRHEPNNFWSTEKAWCAPVTPEVGAAIADARRLHEEAVEASKRWQAAWKAIPRLSQEDFERLPIKPGAAGWEAPINE